LSDLSKYSMTWSVARSLCDSWVSCFLYLCLYTVAHNHHQSMLDCKVCNF